jgi:hypothetical protein
MVGKRPLSVLSIALSLISTFFMGVAQGSYSNYSKIH